MSETSSGETVAFGQKFAASQAFSALFREGMALVEETAAYLDGDGRRDAKKLERGSALTYATESMRLTTRLMQLASWLLLHRAVNEGDMSLDQAGKEKKKVKLTSGEPIDEAVLNAMPARLRELVERSRKLQDKVRRIDATIHAPVPEQQAGDNPLDRHMGLLKAAFERTGA
jgi:regulator of CtrA degradation